MSDNNISNQPSISLPGNNPLDPDATLTTSQTKVINRITNSSNPNSDSTATANAKNLVAISDADNPFIFPPASVDAQKAAAQVFSNPFFTSSFLTTLTATLQEILKMEDKIKTTEMHFTISNMQGVISTAKEMGDLIMAKAQTEAQMHMMLAISGFVSLGVAVAGLAVQIKGMSESYQGKLLKDEVKAESGSSSETIKAGEKSEIAANKATTSKAKNSTLDSDAKAPKADATQEKIATDSKKIKAKENQVEAEGTSTRSAAKKNAQKEALDPDAINKTTTKADPAGITQGAPKSEQIAKNSTETGDNVPAESPSKLAQSRALTAKGERLATIGEFMSRNASTLDSIAQNLIQMVMKPMIASYDQQMEVIRASKELFSRGLENASKDFNDATSMIDQITSALQKMQDENARAFNWQG